MVFILKSQARRAEPCRARVRSSRSGFTLLELIGVMVVIAILATAVLPSTIDLIQVQRSVNEGAELPKIAEALKRGILREQRFPAAQNAASVETSSNNAFWWNVAARHGGGSPNTVRYPLGVRPGSDNTRKLYFAKPDWAGQSFFETTGDGVGWLSDTQNPKELRIVLVSTSGSDLPLPETLTPTQFDALWDDWAIGNDGNPARGAWATYGFNSAAWTARAPELNVQRIDLRDWLSTVVIENRRAILEASGDSFDNSDLSSGSLSLNWVRNSVYAYTENVVDAEVILQTSDLSDGNDPPNFTTRVDGLVLSRRGIVVDASVDEDNPPLIRVKGNEATVNQDGEPIITPREAMIELQLTDLAPLALIDSNDTQSTENLNLANTTVYSIKRYFLSGQELLLGEPWPRSGNPSEYPEVGIFTIDKSFSSLRFDGLQWQY